MEYDKVELMLNNLIRSKNIEGSYLKNDFMNAKNAEIINYGIMHTFNEVP